MDDFIYKKNGIDPNRVPTEAEVELAAYCFGVSLQEARKTLSYRLNGDRNSNAAVPDSPTEAAATCDFMNDHETRQEVSSGFSAAQTA